MSRVQQAIQEVPSWVNWAIITGSAAASWLAPIASLVAIVWGGLQIYTWCKTRPDKKKKGS